MKILACYTSQMKCGTVSWMVSLIGNYFSRVLHCLFITFIKRSGGHLDDLVWFHVANHCSISSHVSYTQCTIVEEVPSTFRCSLCCSCVRVPSRYLCVPTRKDSMYLLLTATLTSCVPPSSVGYLGVWEELGKNSTSPTLPNLKFVFVCAIACVWSFSS